MTYVHLGGEALMKFHNWPLLLRLPLLLYIECTHSKKILCWMQGCRLVAYRSSTCFSYDCSFSVNSGYSVSVLHTWNTWLHTWNTLIIHLQPHKGLEALTLCCCSIAQTSLILCNCMDCSMPGFLVLNHLPEFVQTHVHWVSDAIQPSNPLLSSTSPAFSLSQH